MPYVSSIERIAKQDGREEGVFTGIRQAIDLALESHYTADNNVTLKAQIDQLQQAEQLQSVLQTLISATPISEALETIANVGQKED